MSTDVDTFQLWRDRRNVCPAIHKAWSLREVRSTAGLVKYSGPNRDVTSIRLMSFGQDRSEAVFNLWLWEPKALQKLEERSFPHP